MGATGVCASRDPKGLNKGTAEVGGGRQDKKGQICKQYILLVLLFSFSSKPRKFEQLQNLP